MLEIATPEAILFWALAPLSVIAALGMLVVKNRCAMKVKGPLWV